MAFILEPDEKPFQQIREDWAAYKAYLLSVRDRMPPNAYKLATSREWYDNTVPQCPHDAWLEEFKLIESDPGGTEDRYCSLTIQLLGAYHDGRILIRYPRVFSYQIGSSDSLKGMNDWRYDEFRVSEREHLLHEIVWVGGGHWLIEADDIEFEWHPFDGNDINP